MIIPPHINNLTEIITLTKKYTTNTTNSQKKHQIYTDYAKNTQICTKLYTDDAKHTQNIHKKLDAGRFFNIIIKK